jgi:excisionase family DNA binding protein
VTGDVLTPEQVAERVQVHTRTVMRAIASGDLVASQLARRGCWRITEQAVEAWLEARSNRQQPQRTVPVAQPIDVSSRAAGKHASAGARRRGQRHATTGRVSVPPVSPGRNAA